MLKAVIFDLDGTLVDTLEDLADATNAALIKNGLAPKPLERYYRFVGNGARKLVERAAETTDAALTDMLLTDFVRIYDANCLQKTRPYDGVSETLACLKAEGLALAVVTNKPQEQARKIVAHFFPHTFACVYGGLPERPKKPDPLLVRQVLTELQIAPKEALFVGDSDVDIQTAQNAQVRSVGACWGFRGEAELKAAGADYLAYSFTEIVKMT